VVKKGRRERSTTLLRLVLEVLDEEFKDRGEVASLAKEFYLLYREKGLEGVRKRVEEMIQEVLSK